MKTPATLPANIHPKRLASELEALGLVGVGWSSDGFVIHNDAPSAVRVQIQAVLNAHLGKTQGELDAEATGRGHDGITKRKLIRALLKTVPGLRAELGL